MKLRNADIFVSVILHDKKVPRICVIECTLFRPRSKGVDHILCHLPRIK